MTKRFFFTTTLSFILISGIALGQTTPPSYTLKVGPSGKDSRVSSLAPSNNDQNGCFLQAIAWTFSGTEFVARSLIQFDLSAIAKASDIDSAKLSLFYQGTSCITTEDHSTLSGSNEVQIQRITTSWDENTVTWNNQPTSTSQNEAKIPKTTSDNQDFIAIDVTDLVKDMITNNNYGFLFRLQNETKYRRLSFASGDNGDSTKWPVLEIYTTTTTGIESPSAIHGNFQLYPSPSNDLIKLVSESISTEALTVTVYDSYGRIVKNMLIPQGFKEQTLSCATWAAGTYSVAISSTRSTQILKLVVVH